MKVIIKYLSAIVLLGFLISCSRGNQENKAYQDQDQTASAPAAEKDKTGENLYMKYCMACHQTDGSGVPGMYPPLKKSPVVNSGKKEDFINILLNGLRGPIEVNGQKYNQQMPSQNFLTDEELSQIINFVSESFDNNGTKINPEDVKKLRK